MFQKKRFLLAVLIISGFFITSYVSADKLENVLMPDAYIIGRVNLTNIQASSIAKLIRKDDTVSSEVKVDKINTVLKKYNLSDKDFTSFVVGIKLNIKGFKNINDALLNDGSKEFVFGVQSSKPVTLKQLKNIVIDSSNQDKEINVNVQTIKKDGIDLLLIKNKEKGTTQPIALAALESEKIIIGGIPEAVVDSVKRFKSGKNVVFETELTKLKSEVSKNADFYLVGYIPEAIRDKVGLTREAKPVEKGKKEVVSVEIFKDISALSIQADFTKKLNVNIFAYFITRNSAEDAQKLINQFLPMLKFIAMGSTQGVELPVLDSIDCKISKTKPELKIHLVRGFHKKLEA